MIKPVSGEINNASLNTNNEAVARAIERSVNSLVYLKTHVALADMNIASVGGEEIRRALRKIAVEPP